jgi:hypothetical protein
MMHSPGLQLLGYAASILIATSLLMRSIVRLRLINLAGAATFSLYGFLIGAYPVGVLNLMTVTINIVQLARLYRRRERFRVIEIRSDSPYVEYFLDFQAADIRRFFPSFTWPSRSVPGEPIVLLVLRDLVPASILLGKVEGSRLNVVLDYAVPQYRDLKMGRYLFHDEVAFFRDRGITEIVSPAETIVHTEYLERIGFRKIDNHEYLLPLDEPPSLPQK